MYFLVHLYNNKRLVLNAPPDLKIRGFVFFTSLFMTSLSLCSHWLATIHSIKIVSQSTGTLRIVSKIKAFKKSGLIPTQYKIFIFFQG